MALRAETTSFVLDDFAAGTTTTKGGTSTTLVGRSRAGDATAFAIPEFKWLFDCGAVLEKQGWKPRIIFLTHTHADHVHFLFRFGDQERPPTVYLPEASAPYVEACLKAYDEMTECRATTTTTCTEDHRSEDNNDTGGATEKKARHVVLRGTKADDDIFVSHGGNKFRVHTLSMIHRIPCLGYSIFRLRNTLKEEYRGLPGKEIGLLKKKGVEVTTVEEQPYLCFMGDTTARVFDEYPEILKQHSRVVVECTFIDADSRQRADTTKHTHWDDIQPHIASNPGIMFILIHFSLKYSALSLRRFFRDQQVLYDNIHPMLVEREVEEQWHKTGEEGDPPRCNCRACRH